MDQLLAATVLDLVAVAARRNQNKDGKRLLGCPCLEEMWLCLYRISGSRSGAANFWSMVSACCPDTETDGADKPDMALDGEEELGELVYRPTVQTPLLCWRLTTSLMSIVHHQPATHSLPDTALHKTLRQKLRPLVKKMETSFDEEHLRSVLQIVSTIADRSAPSLDLVSDIWKIFSKASMLNSTFRLKTMTMDGAACLPKSPSLWLAQIQNLDTTGNTGTGSPTSFVTFLKIVDASLARWTRDRPGADAPAVPREVTTLSGRISISLGGSKARQLTEFGVHHTASLCLVLAKVIMMIIVMVIMMMTFLMVMLPRPTRRPTGRNCWSCSTRFWPATRRRLLRHSACSSSRCDSLSWLLLLESELPVAAAVTAMNEQLSAAAESQGRVGSQVMMMMTFLIMIMMAMVT